MNAVKKTLTALAVLAAALAVIFIAGRYPQWTRGNTVFRGQNDRQLRYPRCRATARRPRLPCWPRFLLPKNSKGPAGEKKWGLARKRTKVGWRPPRTMTPPASILAAGRRFAPCPLRVWIPYGVHYIVRFAPMTL